MGAALRELKGWVGPLAHGAWQAGGRPSRGTELLGRLRSRRYPTSPCGRSCVLPLSAGTCAVAGACARSHLLLGLSSFHTFCLLPFHPLGPSPFALLLQKSKPPSVMSKAELEREIKQKRSMLANKYALSLVLLWPHHVLRRYMQADGHLLAQ